MVSGRASDDILAYRVTAHAVSKRFRTPGLETEDLTQEAFLAIVRAALRWEALKPGQPMPSAYAWGWARNVLVKLVRRHRARRAETADWLDELPDGAAEPDTAAIEPLLSLLSEREADVLTLRLGLDGNEARSYGETAQLLGINRKQVQWAETHALITLRKLIPSSFSETPRHLPI